MMNSIINKDILKLFLTVIIAYYFGNIFLRSDIFSAILLLSAVFIIFFLRKNEYVFYFLLATRSLLDIFYGVGTQDIRITQVYGVALFGLFIYYVIVLYRFNIFKFGINKAYIAFLAISLPAVFFCMSLKTGAGYWLRLSQGFIFINLTIFLILDAGHEYYRKTIVRISIAVLLSLVVPLSIFMYNFLSGNYIEIQGIRRFSLFGAYFNAFSYLLLVCFPFMLLLYSYAQSSVAKVRWILFMGLITAVIYLTNTRNVWLGLVLFISIYLLIKRRYMTVLVLSILLILFLFANPAILDRFQDVRTISQSENLEKLDVRVGSSRAGIWTSNLKYFLNDSTFLEKLIGNGFDINERIELNSRFMSKGSHQHSNYLAILMNSGIIGLIIYLIYLVVILKSAIGSLRTTQDIFLNNIAVILIPFVISYAINGVFTHLIWNMTYQYFFSVFIGFLVGVDFLEKNRLQKEVSST